MHLLLPICLASLFICTAYAEYLGCYYDDGHRKLRGEYKTFPHMTPQICIDFCTQKSYVYAGLQFWTYCFCGDQVPVVFDKGSESDCSAKCPGDKSKKCGGTWRNSMYKTGAVPVKHEYLGCYLDDASRKLEGGYKVFGSLTPRICIDYCKEQGYLYAGLQYRVYCFCGNAAPLDCDKKTEGDCSAKCPGDYASKCGGTWRNSIYKTQPVKLEPEHETTTEPEVKEPQHQTTTKPEANPNYMGCYYDDGHRKLRGEYKTFSQMTPEICIDYCKLKSYVYAGLQFWTYCFCGNQVPLVYDERPQGDCSAKCPGNKREKCGGTWRNSIYKTGAVPIEHEYLGCYLDDSRRKLEGGYKVFGSLTPRICIDYCKEQGYLYAGLQYTVYCFCGNAAPLDCDKKTEGDCSHKCPGDYASKCGGTWRNSIYKTEPVKLEPEHETTTEPEVTTEISKVCVRSVTTVNARSTCSGDVIFEESFDTLSPRKWKHDIKIPMKPDYLYVVYDADAANSYISNGQLVIKPTLLPTDQVKRGTLALKDCTGNVSMNECGYQAVSYMILPPVQSARLTTRNSFNFRYGKVEITAKLPLGDWLVPEMSLEPKNDVYGEGYASGRIRIAMSRGNRDLKTNRYNNIGCTVLENFAVMGFEDNVKKVTVQKENENGWYKDYHNYTVLWSPDNIVFSVDGEELAPLIKGNRKRLTDEAGLPADTWTSVSKVAPFDNEFYISVGLYAGGSTDFPDFSVNNGGEFKPWMNSGIKALLNFWRYSNSWKATWHDDLALLQIDHIRVTAL